MVIWVLGLRVGGLGFMFGDGRLFGFRASMHTKV